MAAADELRSLQKHFVCQFEERWNQTDREILYNVAGQRPKTQHQNNQGVHREKEVEGFRPAKSISRF